MEKIALPLSEALENNVAVFHIWEKEQEKPRNVLQWDVSLKAGYQKAGSPCSMIPSSGGLGALCGFVIGSDSKFF